MKIARYSTRIKRLFAKDEVMQYLKTLLVTFERTNTYEEYDDNMRGLQLYLFGVDPIDGYDVDVYIDDIDHLDLFIEDELKTNISAIDILSYNYNGHFIAKIMYDVLMKRGLVGRSIMGINMFSLYKKNGDLIRDMSLIDALYYDIRREKYIKFNWGYYMNDFWVEFNRILKEDQVAMRLITRIHKVERITPYNLMYDDFNTIEYITSPLKHNQFRARGNYCEIRS